MLNPVVTSIILLLSILISIEGTAMAATTYTLEPKEFHSLHMARSTEIAIISSRSDRTNDLLPDMPTGLYGARIHIPHQITITTDELATFVWEEVKIPLCMSYLLKSRDLLDFEEQTVHIKDIRTGNESSFLAEMHRYDNTPPPRVYEKNRASGGSLTYNITFFTDLPRYSSEYEVWVRIGNVESNRERIKVDLLENGKRIKP